MQYRRLGRTGLKVSALALGSRSLDARAWATPDVEAAADALAFGFDAGINAITTSPAFGEAESLVGDLLRRTGRAGEVLVLSTLEPLIPQPLPSPHYHANDVYPARHIRASTEASLKALGVERLGLQQLPAWCPEWSNEGDWLETFHRLKDEGKIAGFGVATFDHDPGAALGAVDAGLVDSVQVMFNLFDPEASADLFPMCRERDVGVVVRSPLYAGALSQHIMTGEPFPPGDWRRDHFYPEHLAETRERVARLGALVSPPDRSVADLALRFCLSHPAVSTVAVGMGTRRHVEDSLRAMMSEGLSTDTLVALAPHRWLC